MAAAAVGCTMNIQPCWLNIIIRPLFGLQGAEDSELETSFNKYAGMVKIVGPRLRELTPRPEAAWMRYHET